MATEQETEAYSGDKQTAYLEKARQSTLDRVVDTLESLEGNERTVEVPSVDGTPIDNSGATVGMGVDIGQMSSTELYALDIPDSLKRRLNPFTNKKGMDAVRAVQRNPVTLTEEEVNKLNKVIKRKELLAAERNVKRETGKSLYDLPSNFRTGLIIQSFQLGNGLFRNRDTNSPTNFRQEVIEGRYDDAADNMFAWNERALPGLRKRYKAVGDLMKGNIELSEVPAAAEFYLDSIRQGVDNVRYQGGASNNEVAEMPAVVQEDPIEQAGVRTVEPEQEEEEGLLNAIRRALSF